MTIDHAEAKRLIQSQSPADRRRVAENPHAEAEMLYYLASDPDDTVRQGVATNGTTPPKADIILAGDPSEQVRAALARKVSLLAPGLDRTETGRLQEITYKTLEQLIADQATRVRQIVSEILKDMPTAPSELVRRLAHDPELVVAAPALEYSPVLSDADLLDVLRQLPCPGAASAIARRTDLSSDVADAISLGTDSAAIAVLLRNTSAQIREETLDQLIARAPPEHAWHRPLVERPKLSDDAVRKLARFVAHDLIVRLKDRTGLTADTLAELDRRVAARLERSEDDAPGELEDDRATREIDRLQAAGHLHESYLIEALDAGRRSLIIAALARLSGTTADLVRKIIGAQSAKGLTALAWKANLSMHFAVQLQIKMARMQVKAMLYAKPDGSYPLAPDAMRWQLDFFQDLSKRQ